MSELKRLKRSRTIPFLNIATLTDPDWARIGKSTIFDLVMNAQTEENDFIETDMTTTDVMSYKPQLDQELQCNKGDKAFDYLYDLYYTLPTGEDVKKNLLIVFDGEAEDNTFRAWNCEATLTIDHFDSVAEKIFFSFAINKIVARCNVKIVEGVPVIQE